VSFVGRKPAFLRIFACLGWIAIGPACGPVDPESELGTAQSAIYGGERDSSSNDAVVALRIGDTTTYRLCTGALIAPNVVLTARHCTSIPATETIGCNAAGQSTNGNQFLADNAPGDIHVYAGVSPLMTASPRANGKQVFRPTTSALCNSDIALVVLDKAIDGIAPLRVRLSGGVAVGEVIRSIGYGENDTNYTSGVRYIQDNVPVMAFGAGVMKNGTVLGSGELEIGRATCQGDSGGPGISAATGAVVGVASRGVGCAQNYGHVYMRTAAMRDLFVQAFSVAGGEPLEEITDTPESTPPGTSGPVTMRRGGCSARIVPGLPFDDAVIGLGVALCALGVRRRKK
jgi:hypothetical protein